MTQKAHLQDDDAHRHQCISGVVLILGDADVKGESITESGTTARMVSIVYPNLLLSEDLHISSIKLKCKKGQDQGWHHKPVESASGYKSALRGVQGRDLTLVQ